MVITDDMLYARRARTQINDMVQELEDKINIILNKGIDNLDVDFLKPIPKTPAPKGGRLSMKTPRTKGGTCAKTRKYCEE